MSDQDLLDCLLNVEEELEQVNEVTEVKKIKGSNVHTGDTDSSDDEDNRDFQNSKYNDFGKSIKQMLNTNENQKSFQNPQRVLQPASWKTKPTAAGNKSDATKLTPAGDVYTDPIFGIRIFKPVVSHAVLKERMQGREAVTMSKVRMFIERLTPQKDWVIAGVIVHKMGKTSQKGNAFAIWTLSDLHGDLKTITLFLFGSAYKELAKCMTGTVVGVLNPTVFEKKKDSKDEACLSVDNYQRVMILGQSKDLGTCKSTKKNGEACSMFVNKSRCEFCLFHIKQEYQKCSKRSELQSNFQGKGLTALRNKVLGKNEVFYAGKSYMAIPAKKSQKLLKQDEGRLSFLSGVNKNSNNIVKAKNTVVAKKKQAQHVEMIASQKLKDIELMKRLTGGVSKVDEKKEADKANKSDDGLKRREEISAEESKKNALAVIAKLKAKKTEGRSPKNCLNSANKLNTITGTLKEDKIDLNNGISKNKSYENGNKNLHTNNDNFNCESIKLNGGNVKDIELDFMKVNVKELDFIKDKIIETKSVLLDEVSKSSSTKLNAVKKITNSNNINSNNSEPKSAVSKLLNKVSANKLNSAENPVLEKAKSKNFESDNLIGSTENSENISAKTTTEFENNSKIDYANILDENNFSEIDFDSSDDDLNNFSPDNKSSPKKKLALENNENIDLRKSLDEAHIPDKSVKVNGNDSKILTVNKNIPANKIKVDTIAKTNGVNKVNGNPKVHVSNVTTDKIKINSSPQVQNNKEANKLKVGASPRVSNQKQTGNKNNSDSQMERNSKQLNLNEKHANISTTTKNISSNQTKTNEANGLNKNSNPQINEIPKTSLNNYKKRFPNLNNVPKLMNTSNSMIDLNASFPNKRVDRAKLGALQWVQKNGPIKKDEGKNKRKRALELASKIESESDPKKQKIQENEFFSERFKKMMAVTSKHTDLVAQRDDEEQEKYFNKLEMKERMEDKMMSTYKVDCKAVRCLQCKYTSFSAADLCKQQRHPLKVFDAVKRFFKCGDCGFRTATLKIIPVESCKNCGSGKWERTTMMKEKTVDKMHSLSIRGGEQANVNSVITDAHINLLVPDE